MDNGATRFIYDAMTRDTDILIAGGGLNGTALALALASGGFRVALVDPTPEATRLSDRFDGRGYALALSSKRLLSALAIWQDVAENAQPILDIRISDGRAGETPSPFVLEFDHANIEEGPMGFMIEDRFLRRALLSAIEACDRITAVSERSVTDHVADDTGVTVKLSDGETVTASLVIGCDGKKSPSAIRAGITRTGWRYGQTSLVCAIEHEKPHRGTAHQYFMPSGPLAILPLPGNRSSIVWTETNDAANRISALDDADYLDVLRPRFGAFLGEIDLAGARFSYPLELSLADRLTGPRLALVGDAAHAVHPVAGQGLNAGLRDIAALSEVLTVARRRGEDVGRSEVLSRYSAWRRFDIASLAIATDTVNRLFSNDSPLLRLGRDLGLGIVGHMPVLKRGLIREAAGLTGDLPRLSRGLSL